LAMTTDNPEAVNQVYNTAVGDRISILEMANHIRDGLIQYDPSIAETEIKFGPHRDGDIPHSQASIDKAKKALNYKPSHRFKEGLTASLEWYYNTLKNE
jgi:UDP-N-acetylglucosamine 4-epimerase